MQRIEKNADKPVLMINFLQMQVRRADLKIAERSHTGHLLENMLYYYVNLQLHI